MKKKILYVLLGNLILGIGIGFGVFANLGTDPGTTLFLGVSKSLKLSLGNSSALINCLLFIPILLYRRHAINLGTFVNMFGLGYIAEYVSGLLSSVVPNLSLIFRFLFLLIAIILICFGAALYLSCNFGQAPWDALAPIVLTFFPKWKYSVVRITQDSLGILIGYFLGASVGIASCIFAFFLGPGIVFFSEKIAAAKLFEESH